MDSAPPATATWQSPSLIAWAADTIACNRCRRPVYGEGRSLDRETAVDRRDPAEVHVAGLGVNDVAEDRVTDIVGLHACPAYHLTHHGRGQIAGRDGGEAASVFADRGPDSGQHQYISALFHDHFLTCPGRR
jgi:hypothetical protein